VKPKSVPEKKPILKVVATNRRALHFYELIETYETGVELRGHEVKSLREGRVDMRDAYARVENGELIVFDLNITPYSSAAIKWKINPSRKRRLMMHKQEISRIAGKVMQRGFTLIPLELYFSHGWVKCKLALAKGKKTFNRKDRIKQRISDRDLSRALKYRR